MENRANFILIGFFVSLMFFASLFFLVWYGNFKDKKAYNYYEIFIEESVAGLSVKAPVKFLGVDVGSVEDISIDNASKKLRVKVLVKLDSSLHIKTDTYASLQIQGITGFKFIQLSGGSEDAPILKANADYKFPIIKTKESFFANIDKQTNNILELVSNAKIKLEKVFNDKNLKNIENILENSSQFITMLNHQVPLFLSDMQNTSGKISKSSDEFSAFLKNTELKLDGLEQSRMLLNESLDIIRTMFLDFNEILYKIKQNPSSIIYKDRQIQYAPGE